MGLEYVIVYSNIYIYVYMRTLPTLTHQDTRDQSNTCMECLGRFKKRVPKGQPLPSKLSTWPWTTGTCTQSSKVNTIRRQIADWLNKQRVFSALLGLGLHVIPRFQHDQAHSPVWGCQYHVVGHCDGLICKRQGWIRGWKKANDRLWPWLLPPERDNIAIAYIFAYMYTICPFGTHPNQLFECVWDYDLPCFWWLQCPSPD